MTSDEFDSLPLMLRVEDVMALLDLGRTSVYEQVRSGSIPSIKLGRAIRIPKHRLAEMIGLDKGTSRAAAHGAIVDDDPTSAHGA